jgi:hypothetical protein
LQNSKKRRNSPDFAKISKSGEDHPIFRKYQKAAKITRFLQNSKRTWEFSVEWFSVESV